MRNILVLAIMFGIIGLVVGYFLFAKYVNGSYIPVDQLITGPHGVFQTVASAFAQNTLPEIRRNIIISGLVGVVAGFVIGVGTRGGRRRGR